MSAARRALWPLLGAGMSLPAILAPMASQHVLCSRCLPADGHVPLLRAEPLIGNNTDPPEPYNTTAVRSVVRWGTEAGSLTEETEQDHRLVYSYVYGPGE